MPRRKFDSMGIRFMGRKRTAPRHSWRKQEWIKDEFHPQGVLADVTPMPGHTYTRYTWPPRGRAVANHLPARAALMQSCVPCRCFGCAWLAIPGIRLHIV